MRIITRSKYNAHTDPLFKSLNLLKLKDLFELSVFKINFKFKHNLLPVYVSNMSTESIRNHPYNLRTRGPLEFVNSSTASGEKCLRCYLPNFINNSSPQVLDKINTHSYEGFSFFIKDIWAWDGHASWWPMGVTIPWVMTAGGDSLYQVNRTVATGIFTQWFHQLVVSGSLPLVEPVSHRRHDWQLHQEGRTLCCQCCQKWQIQGEI